MKEIRLEKGAVGRNYEEKKVIIDNVPDLGDMTGENFLKHLENAIVQCRDLIDKDYRLVNFWIHANHEIEFILKKFY